MPNKDAFYDFLQGCIGRQMLFCKLYVSTRFFPFRRWSLFKSSGNEISKVNAVETGWSWIDWSLVVRFQASIWGNKSAYIFKLDFETRRTWNDQGHESWLWDTLLSHNIDMSGIVGHNLKMFRLVLAIYTYSIYTFLLAYCFLKSIPCFETSNT